MSDRLLRLATLVGGLFVVSLVAGACDCQGGRGTTEDAVDGEGDAMGAVCTDEDNDGYYAEPGCEQSKTDCDDGNIAINPGAEESCNRKDEDCDGAVDEGCSCTPGSRRLCSSHVKNPQKLGPQTYCRAGIQRCNQQGNWGGKCLGERGPRAEELCNGIDDDCDGEIDEGVRNAAGECSDEEAAEECGMHGEGNGLDDDGDGKVDEDCSCDVPDLPPEDDPGNLPRKEQPCYSGPPQTLGVGICRGGTRNCSQSGMWGECKGEVKPQEETCGDGVDNDCDGHADEGCCDPADEETCNGLDDDCDGEIDEGVAKACGACPSEVSSKEKCGDGKDNNCDGQLEEGCGGCTAAKLDCFPGPPNKAGTGRCEYGTMKCEGESFGACKGAVLPTREQCGADGTGNGKDDDCDGQADEGCICTPGETRKCGKKAGICEQGTQTCESDATWGRCTGQTPPKEGETCNGKDDDCDGLVDENVKNACGKCGSYCYTDTTDPTKEGKTDDGAKKIPKNDPDNPTNRSGVTLSKKDTFPPYLWVANDNDDTVSKFDTTPGNQQEVGRFPAGDDPSRTAVDLDGNMWVVARRDGKVTKVISDHSDCIDRNNNGSIETSRPGNLTQYLDRSNPKKDECVAFSKDVYPGGLGNCCGNGGGVAADSTGTVWVGYGNVTNTRNGKGGIQSFDPRTNKPSNMVWIGNNTPVWEPNSNNVYQKTSDTNFPGLVYGLVGDSEGNIYSVHWSNGRSRRFARFDTRNRQWDRIYRVRNYGCSPYGIALDGKDRVFLGCVRNDGVVGMYNPDNEKLTVFSMPSGTSLSQSLTGVKKVPAKLNCTSCTNPSVTALTVEPKTGDVWAAIRNKGLIGRLDIDNQNLSNSEWTIFNAWPNTTKNFSLRGIGFDPKGTAWHMGPKQDEIVELDPSQNKQVDKHTVGAGNSHYTYSDFTGATAISFTAPRGIWRYFLDTNFPNAEADELIIEAYVPQKTSLKVRIRALDKNKNPTSMWIPRQGGSSSWWTYPPGTSRHRIDVKAPPGGLISGRIFEVEIRLQTQTSKQRPILHDVKLRWQRP